MAKSNVNIKKAILLRISVAFGLVCLFAFAIIYKVFSIQVYEGSHWKEEQKKQSTRVRKVKANRGNIYAADGSLLATSIPRYDLHFDTRVDGLKRSHFEAKLDSLAFLFYSALGQKSRDEWKRFFKQAYNSGDRDVLVAKDLDFEQVKLMNSWPILRDGRFKGGFWKEEKNKRIYFMGELARRTIGYTDTMRKVYIGLEGAFDTILAGRDGQRLEQRAYGSWRPVMNDDYLEPQNGYDVVTTLDVGIQDVAQYALKKALEVNEADNGCAILMEVKTGAIKAIANLKRTSDGRYIEADNYAVNDFSDPGSTFKLVTALALLEDGKVKPEDSVNNNWGKVTIYGKDLEDSKKPTKPYYTLQESFEKSSNVAFAKLVMNAYQKNPKGYLKYIKRLKLDQPMDFDIRARYKPYYKTPGQADWYGTTLPWMSIGYEQRVSPLQILSVYNAVANKGVLMKPYMVSEIRDMGRTVKQVQPVVLEEKIASEETIKALRSMMEGVVQHGTATNLKDLEYKVAGKTGTARLLTADGYDEHSHKASFVGYFPADNPLYSCIVVVNAPRKNEYYGGLVAGPVFKEIADKVYSMNWQMHPEMRMASLPQLPDVKPGNRYAAKTVLNFLGISSRTDTSAMSGSWVRFRKSGYSLELIGFKEGAGVPDVRGMGLADALVVLENRRYRVTVSGYGKVSSVNPPPGTQLPEGSFVNITLNP